MREIYAVVSGAYAAEAEDAVQVRASFELYSRSVTAAAEFFKALRRFRVAGIVKSDSPVYCTQQKKDKEVSPAKAPAGDIFVLCKTGPHIRYETVEDRNAYNDCYG